MDAQAMARGPGRRLPSLAELTPRTRAHPGPCSSRCEQTRRCHKFEDEHLDDKQVSTTQNVGDIPISTPRPGSLQEAFDDLSGIAKVKV